MSCPTMGCAIVAPNIAAAAAPASRCSGTVVFTLNTSALGIGDGPGYYTGSMRCIWVVSASGPITIRFSEFITESDADYVNLYDGVSVDAPPLGSLSGLGGSSSGELPAAITSTGGALTVTFNSDQTGCNPGFSATLSSASTNAAWRLVSTVPASLGELLCVGRITRMCVRPVSQMLRSGLQFAYAAGT